MGLVLSSLKFCTLAKTANSCWKEIYAEQNNCISVRTPIQAEQQVRKLLRETELNLHLKFVKPLKIRHQPENMKQILLDDFVRFMGEVHPLGIKQTDDCYPSS